jgi:hypothetical protein
VIDQLTEQGQSISSIVTLLEQDSQLMERVERRLHQMYRYTKYIAYRLNHSYEPVLEPESSYAQSKPIPDPTLSDSVLGGGSQSARSSYRLTQ